MPDSYFSLVPDAVEVKGPLRVGMSAQKKTLQGGSETKARELPEGTKENKILPVEGSWIYPPLKSIILTKTNRN